MPPICSVLMPVYNLQSYAPWLQDNFIKTITSYIENNIECVLVDDKSTDDTLRILYDQFGLKNKKSRELHLPENLIIYEKAKNLGVSTSLNIAGELASGEYYTMGSIRSWYTPGDLIKMVESLMGNLDVGIVYAQTQYHGASDHLIQNPPGTAMDYIKTFKTLQGYLYRSQSFDLGLRYMTGCFRDGVWVYPSDHQFFNELVFYLGYRVEMLSDVTFNYYFSGEKQQSVVFNKYQTEIMNIFEALWKNEGFYLEGSDSV